MPRSSAHPARPRRRPAAGDRPGGPASDLRRRLGLTRKSFSRLTGYSERALAGWEGGEQPGEAGRQRLAEIERLRRALARVIRGQEVSGWLTAPNRAFGGLKPLEVVERGEIDRIWRMIFYLESGIAR